MGDLRQYHDYWRSADTANQAGHQQLGIDYAE